ncbi:MAG: diacylglycerol kinase family protein [Erysipelotrichaceae bacterium]|nr:diacylglycerol kinase family protein [Erysipelotrichaceae bacterium]
MKFKHAFDGLISALKEKAVITQVVLAIMAIIGGVIIKLDNYEWLAFIICIVGVISLEIMNSVVEKLCDLYSTEHNEKIKIIKDMASAAVLVFAVGALVVCVICTLRRF